MCIRWFMRASESRHYTHVAVLAVGLTVLIFRQLATLQSQVVPASFAISHVTVINTDNGSSNDDMTVIVTGDRIADLGKSNAVKVPSGASVLDARGKFLLPGLWELSGPSANYYRRHLSRHVAEWDHPGRWSESASCGHDQRR